MAVCAGHNQKTEGKSPDHLQEQLFPRVEHHEKARGLLLEVQDHLDQWNSDFLERTVEHIPMRQDLDPPRALQPYLPSLLHVEEPRDRHRR